MCNSLVYLMLCFVCCIFSAVEPTFMWGGGANQHGIYQTLQQTTRNIVVFYMYWLQTLVFRRPRLANAALGTSPYKIFIDLRPLRLELLTGWPLLGCGQMG